MDEVSKTSGSNVRDIHIDSLVPNPDNVNEMDEEGLKVLSENISEVGFIGSIQVVEGDNGKYLILDGHQRYLASKRIGLTYLPATILTDAKWKDKDFFDLQSFRLNNIKGTSNQNRYIKFHERMTQLYGPESVMQVLAITDKANAKKLSRMVKSSLKLTGATEDTLKKVDEAEKRSKDLNQFTKYVNKIFTDQSQSSMSGCVLFTNGSNEHMMIQASDKVFNSMKAVSSLAASQGKNINDYLEEPLLEILSRGLT